MIRGRGETEGWEGLISRQNGSALSASGTRKGKLGHLATRTLSHVQAERTWMDPERGRDAHMRICTHDRTRTRTRIHIHPHTHTHTHTSTHTHPHTHTHRSSRRPSLWLATILRCPLGGTPHSNSSMTLYQPRFSRSAAHGTTRSPSLLPRHPLRGHTNRKQRTHQEDQVTPRWLTTTLFTDTREHAAAAGKSAAGDARVVDGRGLTFLPLARSHGK